MDCLGGRQWSKQPPSDQVCQTGNQTLQHLWHKKQLTSIWQRWMSLQVLPPPAEELNLLLVEKK